MYRSDRKEEVCTQTSHSMDCSAWISSGVPSRSRSGWNLFSGKCSDGSVRWVLGDTNSTLSRSKETRILSKGVLFFIVSNLPDNIHDLRGPLRALVQGIFAEGFGCVIHPHQGVFIRVQVTVYSALNCFSSCARFSGSAAAFLPVPVTMPVTRIL